MAGIIGWRLLVTFWLILVVSALRGQVSPLNRPDLSVLPLSAGSRAEPPARISYPPISRPQPILHILPRMLQSSGIIFSGRVIRVSRAGVTPGEEATPTVITFQVQHAIRGAVAGQNLTIREWAGLWNRGERYRVGERVFLFLYPPSRLGLTSPVAGPLGRLGMDPQERILMRPEAVVAFAPDLLFARKNVIPYEDFRQALQRIGY
jgi:hypothetical protein